MIKVKSEYLKYIIILIHLMKKFLTYIENLLKKPEFKNFSLMSDLSYNNTNDKLSCRFLRFRYNDFLINNKMFFIRDKRNMVGYMPSSNSFYLKSLISDDLSISCTNSLVNISVNFDKQTKLDFGVGSEPIFGIERIIGPLSVRFFFNCSERVDYSLSLKACISNSRLDTVFGNMKNSPTFDHSNILHDDIYGEDDRHNMFHMIIRNGHIDDHYGSSCGAKVRVGNNVVIGFDANRCSALKFFFGIST